jgi:hypothetical protein
MNERATAAEVYERAKKVKSALGRLSHCAMRAPAKLRQLLDEKISTVLKRGDVDLELFEDLFQTSRAAFEDFRDAEAARTGLLAFGVYRQHGYDTLGLIADFSALSPPSQEECKSALSLAISSGGRNWRCGCIQNAGRRGSNSCESAQRRSRPRHALRQGRCHCMAELRVASWARVEVPRSELHKQVSPILRLDPCGSRKFHPAGFARQGRISA